MTTLMPNMTGMTTASGLPIGDGSWELRILVTDLQVERTIRVRGDLHVGGVMIRLVDELGRNQWNFVIIRFPLSFKSWERLHG